MVKLLSFDCARYSMGVALIEKNDIKNIAPLGKNPTLDDLEQQVKWISDTLDQIIQVHYSEVWDLRTDKDLDKPWDIANALKPRLSTLTCDKLVYEFQMNQNDKSRMVSSMICYHYAPIETICVPPAKKNKMTLPNITREKFAKYCPILSNKKVGKKKIIDAIFEKKEKVDLSLQTFLKLHNDTYAANKMHTSAIYEWWFNIFKIPIKYEKMDDKADAFIQALLVHPH